MWILMYGIYLNEELFQVVGCKPTQLLNVLLERYMFQFSLILKLLLELSSVVQMLFPS